MTFENLKASDFNVTTIQFCSPQRLLELRDEVALIDPDEDPDSQAGCAAARILALHNELITGEAA